MAAPVGLGPGRSRQPGRRARAPRGTQRLGLGSAGRVSALGRCRRLSSSVTVAVAAVAVVREVEAIAAALALAGVEALRLAIEAGAARRARRLRHVCV